MPRKRETPTQKAGRAGIAPIPKKPTATRIGASAGGWLQQTAMGGKGSYLDGSLALRDVKLANRWDGEWA